MELVPLMYNVHPYFSLRNLDKNVRIICGKICVLHEPVVCATVPLLTCGSPSSSAWMRSRVAPAAGELVCSLPAADWQPSPGFHFRAATHPLSSHRLLPR